MSLRSGKVSDSSRPRASDVPHAAALALAGSHAPRAPDASVSLFRSAGGFLLGAGPFRPNRALRVHLEMHHRNPLCRVRWHTCSHVFAARFSSRRSGMESRCGVRRGSFRCRRCLCCVHSSLPPRTLAPGCGRVRSLEVRAFCGHRGKLDLPALRGTRLNVRRLARLARGCFMA